MSEVDSRIFSRLVLFAGIKLQHYVSNIMHMLYSTNTLYVFTNKVQRIHLTEFKETMHYIYIWVRVSLAFGQ